MAQLVLPVTNLGVPFWGKYERQLIVHKRWGLIGAQIHRSVSWTRMGTITGTVTGHETEQAFWDAINIMDRMMDEAKAGSFFLRGIEYPECTFMGWDPATPPFLDGSGRNGWTQKGKMHLLQVRTKRTQQQGGQ